MSRFLYGAAALLLSASFLSAGQTEQHTAALVDRLLSEQFTRDGVTPAAIVSDETFLRRVTLDLAGTVPSPRDITAFGLDSDPSKRAEAIDRLLESQAFGETWASYWTDVIFLRATEARSRLAQPAFEQWMREQLNENRPWDEIARELITATGPVRETGQTGLIFAHLGNPEELAAEISRIFLGIQLSCANCHDHPTDSWKREQFHQLAAFLPRVALRQEERGNPRSFTVVSFDEEPGGRASMFTPEQVFRFMDRNRDGKLAKGEARGRLATRFDQILEYSDRDHDGKLSAEEFVDIQLQANNQPGRGAREYYMPDLTNPASRGTLTKPVFFIEGVSGPQPGLGASDDERRDALADYVTASDNQWFSVAFVNRVWGTLLGQGFYSPIDDLGPERKAIQPEVLQALSAGFVDSGYDVKWLYRTILLTDAYQRQISSEVTAPFAAAVPIKLRYDQVYKSLFAVLGISTSFRGRDRFPQAAMMRSYGLDPRKVAFATVFGYDPSTPQSDLVGSIPQALLMINSPQLDQQIQAAGLTRLAGILHEFDDDEAALDELYLMMLARLPTANEVDINRAYIAEVGQRGDAFEDIMWSLMNSTEFLMRR